MWVKKKTRLGYFNVLVSGETWQNLEIEKAMKYVEGLLGKETKITWVWDRGFDDRKNYNRINSMEDKFIGRFYHNRVVQRYGKETKIFDLKLNKGLRFESEMKWRGRKRKVEVELKWGGCKLERKEGKDGTEETSYPPLDKKLYHPFDKRSSLISKSSIQGKQGVF
ncbi:MAG: hypothetical protein AB1630_13085 [bacterium]